MANQKKEDFSIKETKPSIRAKKPVKGPTTFLDLVEEMLYLYVNIERADIKPVHNQLPVELKIGNYRGNTDYAPRSYAGEFEWKQVFAFSKSRLQDTTVQVSVKDGYGVVVSKFNFGVSEALKRVPPDPPAVAQWYPLIDTKGDNRLLMSFWTGTQADENYNTARHFDASAPLDPWGLSSIPRQEYTTPRFWYLRVEVIAAQDLVINGISNRAQPAQILVDARVLVDAGVLDCWCSGKATTTPCLTKTRDTKWNETLMFAVAEPFNARLVVQVLNVGVPALLGFCEIPISKVGKRNDRSPPPSLWYDLKVMEGEGTTPRFASKINMKISLDGGYHVSDEPIQFSSDLRPSAKILWTPPIGIFELGIMSASGLSPVEPKTTVNTFCIAKYGPKWVRTRTVVDNCSPKWNEQFLWEVYDHCTVITIAVFENKYVGGEPLPDDWAIGKVRIRLSDLQLNKVYTNSHPLVKLTPYGVRKEGELQLSYRFSPTSMLNVYSRYTVPLLPKLHYTLPLSVPQILELRSQAVELTVSKLQGNKSPLSSELVRYVLEDNHKFSLRRAKANRFRCEKLLDSFSFCKQQYDQLRNWTNLWHNAIFYLCLVAVFWWPSLALSSMFFMLCGLGAWGYRKRPRQLPHMDTELSIVYSVHHDEIAEELETNLPGVPNHLIRMRYERLRDSMLIVQTMLGDIATTGEKVQCLLSWRDKRATLLVLIFCFCVGLVFYFQVPDLRTLSFCVIVWMFRGPRYRIGLPSIFENFILRMPSKVDSML